MASPPGATRAARRERAVEVEERAARERRVRAAAPEDQHRPVVHRPPIAKTGGGRAVQTPLSLLHECIFCTENR